MAAAVKSLVTDELKAIEGTGGEYGHKIIED